MFNRLHQSKLREAHDSAQVFLRAQILLLRKLLREKFCQNFVSPRVHGQFYISDGLLQMALSMIQRYSYQYLYFKVLILVLIDSVMQ